MRKKQFKQPSWFFVGNDVFQGTREQIKALRMCLGWTREASAKFYRKPIESYKQWERGDSSPSPLIKYRMLAMVEKFRDDYVRAAELINEYERLRIQYAEHLKQLSNEILGKGIKNLESDDAKDS